MKSFIKHNGLPLAIYLVLFGLSVWFLARFNKQQIHLFSNSFVGYKPVDLFFLSVTYFGDGTVAVFLLAGLLLYNVRLGIYSTFTFLLASLTSIGLKHLFFDDENRPFFIFNYYTEHKLKLVEGEHIYIHNSFPSGHTTQAFAIFMCLVFTLPKTWQKLSFLALAVFTAYSRVHLSQHWLLDITAGSMIGVLYSLLVYYFIFPAGRFNSLNASLPSIIQQWRAR